MEGHPAIDAFLKAGILSTIMIAVTPAWLLAGATLTGLIRRKRLSHAINIGFAALLILSVGFALLL